MPTFEMDDGRVRVVLERMVNLYHPELRDAGVTFDLIIAYSDKDENGDSTGSPLKLHGYPCAAVVRITKLKERVAGRADAEITVDGEQWPLWEDDQKDALIEHEANHLELQVDKEGGVKRDDLDRPKMKCRIHDRQFGFFDACARRHGRASMEVMQFTGFRDGAFKQLWEQYIDVPDKTPVVSVKP